MKGSLPVIRPREGRVDYSIPPASRFLALAGSLLLVGTGFLVPVEGGLPRALWWATALVLALAALSEDRWIFDTGRGLIRRRFGLVFLARRWSISLDEARSIALVRGESADVGRIPGGGPGAGSTPRPGLQPDAYDEGERLAVSLQGLGRGPWIALVLRLSDERQAILAAARRKTRARPLDASPGAAGRAAPRAARRATRREAPSAAEARLRADGRRLAEFAGLPFVDGEE